MLVLKEMRYQIEERQNGFWKEFCAGELHVPGQALIRSITGLP